MSSFNILIFICFIFILYVILKLHNDVSCNNFYLFLNENNYDNDETNEIHELQNLHELIPTISNEIKEETNIEKISNFINNTTTKLVDKLNDRYNRKKNKHILDDELYDIIKQEDDITDNEFIKKINDNKDNTINNKKNMDSKINNKNKKSQSLFKDSLTIRNNFTKDSIKGDFVDELNYYENLRTPWWYESTEEINY
jgi:hypothetical protein